MKKIYSFSIAVILAATTNAQSIVDFESFGLNPESYDNGSAGNGDFTIGDLTFTNYYNASWMSWNGFTVSNTTDVTTAGYLNDFSAFTSPATIFSLKLARIVDEEVDILGPARTKLNKRKIKFEINFIFCMKGARFSVG